VSLQTKLQKLNGITLSNIFFVIKGMYECMMVKISTGSGELHPGFCMQRRGLGLYLFGKRVMGERPGGICTLCIKMLM
jgi:hypothetical protein